MNFWTKVRKFLSRRTRRIQKERCMAMSAVLADLGDPCNKCYNEHCPNHPKYHISD